MLKHRNPALIIALLLIGFLLLLLPLYKPADAPLFFLFLGRFHPLVLHFPIVLIIAVALLEIAKRYTPVKANEMVIKTLLIAAAISTLAAIGAGFFLYASGEYSGNLINTHYWAAGITGFLILLTTAVYLMGRDNKHYQMIYLSGLVLSMLSVGYTSHIGGSVTHGQDYLTEHLILMTSQKKEVKPEKTESEMLVYEDMIAPVFEAKCLSCHNEQKSKGDLLMTSYDHLLKAGKSGNPALVASDLEKSELYKRVMLPPDHEDHMPPEGKTPLTENEIALLKYWIEAGAANNLLVREARQKDTIATVIDQLMPDLKRYRMKMEMEQLKTAEAQEELFKIAGEINVAINRDHENEGNYFMLAMRFPPARFTNDYFRKLKPYFEIFTKVSLTSSEIDDAGLYYIGQMSNLKELYLQKTKLNGSGLIHLQQLKNLEVLNLSFTQVDDKSALELLKFPALKKVYVYRSNVTKEVVEALNKYRPQVQVLMEEGPYF